MNHKKCVWQPTSLLSPYYTNSRTGYYYYFLNMNYWKTKHFTVPWNRNNCGSSLQSKMRKIHKVPTSSSSLYWLKILLFSCFRSTTIQLPPLQPRTWSKISRSIHDARLQRLQITNDGNNWALKCKSNEWK